MSCFVQTCDQVITGTELQKIIPTKNIGIPCEFLGTISTITYALKTFRLKGLYYARHHNSLLIINRP